MLRRPETEQQEYWSNVYAQTPAFFGEEASAFAHRALDRFRQDDVKAVLELGFGQGRDTLWFAEQGLEVTGLDYSEQAVGKLTAEAQDRGLGDRVAAQVHDVDRKSVV